jgi:hypothetical protein
VRGGRQGRIAFFECGFSPGTSCEEGGPLFLWKFYFLCLHKLLFLAYSGELDKFILRFNISFNVFIIFSLLLHGVILVEEENNILLSPIVVIGLLLHGVVWRGNQTLIEEIADVLVAPAAVQEVGRVQALLLPQLLLLGLLPFFFEHE